MGDINEPSGNGKPKYRISYFRWNYDDIAAETNHLGHVPHSALMRLHQALWRTEDYTLPDDPKLLTRIIRGGNRHSNARWDDQLKEQLAGAIEVKDGRVSSPWLTRKCTQAASKLSLKWSPLGSPAPSKPLKYKGPTSPNREYRIYNKEPANAPLGGGVAVREEASKEERVGRPRTPEEQAEVDAKVLSYEAAKKRRTVQQNLGITEGEIQQLTEDYRDEHQVDAGGSENDAGGNTA
jgi:hypothetical protein